MELMKAYSFLGRSTGIVGHDNINNKSRHEGKDEGLVVNSLSWPWEEEILIDDWSEPIDTKTLNSEYRDVLEWITKEIKLRRKERSKRGKRRENELRVWEIWGRNGGNKELVMKPFYGKYIERRINEIDE